MHLHPNLLSPKTVPEKRPSPCTKPVPPMAVCTSWPPIAGMEPWITSDPVGVG